MKKKQFFVFLALALAGCASTGGRGTGAESRPALPAGAYYTGEGGAGKSITILPLRTTGLSDYQKTYLPGVVQGEFIADFSRYSAISQLDRANLDQIYEEILSTGFYDEQAEAGFDLGHLVPTGYFLNGSITRTPAGDYSLQVQITSSADKIIAASYSGVCTVADMENYRAIRAASRELLRKLGVELTKQALAELAQAAGEKETKVNKTMAQFRAAKDDEEKNYYKQQLLKLDPSLAEAPEVKSFTALDYKPEKISLPKTTIADTKLPDTRMPDLPKTELPKTRIPEFKAVATSLGDSVRGTVARYRAERDAAANRQKELESAMDARKGAIERGMKEHWEANKQAERGLQGAVGTQYRTFQADLQKRREALLARRSDLLKEQAAQLVSQHDLIERLSKSEDFYEKLFSEHPPFEIIYDPNVKQVGAVNVHTETVTLETRVTSTGSAGLQVRKTTRDEFSASLGVVEQNLRTINTALESVEAELAKLDAADAAYRESAASGYAAQLAKLDAGDREYMAQLAAAETTYAAQLESAEQKFQGQLEKDGKEYAAERYTEIKAYREGLVREYTAYSEQLAAEYGPDKDYMARLAAEYPAQAPYHADTDKTLGETWSLGAWNKDTSQVFDITAALINEEGNTVGRANVRLENIIKAAAYTEPFNDSEPCVFRDVPVDGITGRLTVVIQSVNGKDSGDGSFDISAIRKNGRTESGFDLGGYDPKGRYANGAALKVGDEGPAGGAVFYDKGKFTDGWRFLEAAPEDFTGNRLQAEEVCAAYTLNGFDDWFLPDYSEMKLLKKNRAMEGLGGFGSTWYWSSSPDKVVKFGSVDTGTVDRFKKVISAEWRFATWMVLWALVPGVPAIIATTVTAPVWMPVMWASRYSSAVTNARNEGSVNGVRPIRRF